MGRPQSGTSRPGVPSQVMWAFRLWAASGTLLSMWGVFAGVNAFVQGGTTFGELGLAVLLVLIGLGYGFAVRRLLGENDPRTRAALAVATLSVVVLLLVAALLFRGPFFAIALVLALIGLFGSLFAYRPEAQAWYEREAGTR